MITKLMNSLGIKYYEFIPGTRTLIIYESLPVKVMLFIRNQLKDVNLVIKG